MPKLIFASPRAVRSAFSRSTASMALRAFKPAQSDHSDLLPVGIAGETAQIRQQDNRADDLRRSALDRAVVNLLAAAPADIGVEQVDGDALQDMTLRPWAEQPGSFMQRDDLTIGKTADAIGGEGDEGRSMP